jgi:Asp-tRNA(Asn)/Glu-tRNA(Gln) amidotransferase A subunit family amidase
MKVGEWHEASAGRMALAVRSGEVTASELLDASLQRIAAVDGRVNAFTDLITQRARARAAVLDEWIAQAGSGRRNPPSSIWSAT